MKITFLAGVLVDKYIYLSNWLANGLYKMNIENGKCELITLFLEESNISHLHNYAFLYNDVIWFIPSAGKKIACFDLQSNRMDYIELPVEGKVILDANGANTFKFECLYQPETSFCWLVPVGYNMLIRLDMENSNIESFNNWPKDIKWENGIINFHCSYIEDEKIYIMPYNACCGLKVDIRTGEIKKYSVKGINKCRVVIPLRNKILYMPGRLKEGICIYDKEDHSMQKIDVFDDVQENFYLTYYLLGDELVMAPFLGKKMLHINLKSLKANFVDNEKIDSDSKISYFQRCLKVNDVYYVISDRMNKILKVYSDGQNDSLEIEIDESKVYDAWSNIYKKNSAARVFSDVKILYKNESTFNISHFLNCIRNGVQNKEINELNIGEKIVSTLK